MNQIKYRSRKCKQMALDCLPITKDEIHCKISLSILPNGISHCDTVLPCASLMLVLSIRMVIVYSAT